LTSTILDSSDFNYTVNLSLTNIKQLKIATKFTDATVVSFLSKRFSNYIDCLTSAHAFLQEVQMQAQICDRRFKILAEISKDFGGENTKTDQWGHNEVCRLWLYDVDLPEFESNAIACAKIELDVKEYIRAC
jgi:hypothetical protein